MSMCTTPTHLIHFSYTPHSQAYISGLPLKSFALSSDCMFIAQSAARIARGLFHISLAKGWVSYADKVLRLPRESKRPLVRCKRRLAKSALHVREQRKKRKTRFCIFVF